MRDDVSCPHNHQRLEVLEQRSLATMSDPRFHRLKSDPRFRSLKRHKNKVAVDSRFNSLFKKQSDIG